MSLIASLLCSIWSAMMHKFGLAWTLAVVTTRSSLTYSHLNSGTITQLQRHTLHSILLKSFGFIVIASSFNYAETTHTRFELMTKK